MLARMLRTLLAVQLALGAALGYWLADAASPLATPWLWMLLTAVATVLLGALLTTLFCALKSRAEEPAPAWWRALLGECWAGLRIFMLRQPWAFQPPLLQAAQATPARLPVLLVHGFVCNHRIWDDLAPALRAQGHAVYAIDLEPVFGSIEDYVPRIEAAVQALRQHSGQERVALVGHSMGGLAIRAWLRRHGSAHCARVLTLGTPHAGTQLSAWAPMPNGAQMAWHSPWLLELAASESDATRALLRIALSPQDNIVFPQRAQTLQGVVPVVFAGLGHLQLCTDAAVRRWVCQELALG